MELGGERKLVSTIPYSPMVFDRCLLPHTILYAPAVVSNLHIYITCGGVGVAEGVSGLYRFCGYNLM